MTNPIDVHEPMEEDLTTLHNILAVKALETGELSMDDTASTTCTEESDVVITTPVGSVKDIKDLFSQKGKDTETEKVSDTAVYTEKSINHAVQTDRVLPSGEPEQHQQLSMIHGSSHAENTQHQDGQSC